jgi:hypothetical protein
MTIFNKPAERPFRQWVSRARSPVACEPPVQRRVYSSALEREANGYRLARYMADRAPSFYYDPRHIIKKIQLGYIGTAMEDVYRRLPTSKWFQQSHFAEILASIFAEEYIGWRPIYSKLSILSTENSNAYTNRAWPCRII